MNAQICDVDRRALITRFGQRSKENVNQEWFRGFTVEVTVRCKKITKISEKKSFSGNKP